MPHDYNYEYDIYCLLGQSCLSFVIVNAYINFRGTLDDGSENSCLDKMHNNNY